MLAEGADCAGAAAVVALNVPFGETVGAVVSDLLEVTESIGIVPLAAGFAPQPVA